MKLWARMDALLVGRLHGGHRRVRADGVEAQAVDLQQLRWMVATKAAKSPRSRGLDVDRPAQLLAASRAPGPDHGHAKGLVRAGMGPRGDCVVPRGLYHGAADGMARAARLQP